MSSQEVVVRSLLEVLQEFGEADQGEREVRAEGGRTTVWRVVGGPTAFRGRRRRRLLLYLARQQRCMIPDYANVMGGNLKVVRCGRCRCEACATSITVIGDRFRFWTARMHIVAHVLSAHWCL